MRTRTTLAVAMGATLLAGAAGSAFAGTVILTGHDADNHAMYGTYGVPGSADAARRFINKSVKFITGWDSSPRKLKVLLVSHDGDPTTTHAGVVDSVLGVYTALADGANGGFGAYGVGFDLDVADGNAHNAGDQTILHDGKAFDIVDVSTVNFTPYDVIIVASNYGGTLTDAEEAPLVARKSEVIDYINGNAKGGVLAFAEVTHLDEMSDNTRDLVNPFGFVPAPPTSTALTHDESNYTVDTFGLGYGLDSTDVNGNYSHVIFNSASVIGGGTYELIDHIPGDPDAVPPTDDEIITIGTSTKIETGGPVVPGDIGGCVFSGCGVDFGAAATLQWFQFDDGDSEKLDVDGVLTFIGGTVGVAGGEKLDAKTGTIAGDLSLASDDSGADSKIGKSFVITGLTSSLPLHQAEADCIAASNAAAALTVTQQFTGKVKADRKDGNFELDSTGSCNVIDFRKDVELHDVTFTLKGAAGDHFVLNFHDDLRMDHVTMVLTGGITESGVLFNFPDDHGGNCEIRHSIAFGTFVLQDSHFNLDRSVLYGHVFAGDDSKCRNGWVTCDTTLSLPTFPGGVGFQAKKAKKN